MTGVLLLLPDCVLPGCRNVGPAAGQPCAECIELFDGSLGGWAIRPTGGPAMTAEQVTERDAAVAAAYAQQAQTVAASTRPQRERRRNQMCWICDSRRTCVRVLVGSEFRWECSSCEEIR